MHRPLPQDDPLQRCPDITLAKKVLGWKPKIDLDAGLAETAAFFQADVDGFEGATIDDRRITIAHASAHPPAKPAGEANVVPKVAVVILNWNDGAATLACLDALASANYPNIMTIVVDNGSTDGSAQRIRDTVAVDLVINPTNLGFTGGVNVGIARAMAAGADYVWLLNSDATIQPGVLSRLVAVAESDDRIGLVSPVFRDPNRPAVSEFCLGRFDPEARVATQTADPRIAADWECDYPDQIVLLGKALLIRRRN